MFVGRTSVLPAVLAVGVVPAAALRPDGARRPVDRGKLAGLLALRFGSVVGAGARPVAVRPTPRAARGAN